MGKVKEKLLYNDPESDMPCGYTQDSCKVITKDEYLQERARINESVLSLKAKLLLFTLIASSWTALIFFMNKAV